MNNNYLKYFLDEKYQLNHHTNINIIISNSSIRLENENAYICQNNQFRLFNNNVNNIILDIKAIKEYIIPCKTKGQYIKTFDQPTNLVI